MVLNIWIQGPALVWTENQIILMLNSWLVLGTKKKKKSRLNEIDGAYKTRITPQIWSYSSDLILLHKKVKTSAVEQIHK